MAEISVGSVAFSTRPDTSHGNKEKKKIVFFVRNNSSSQNGGGARGYVGVGGRGAMLVSLSMNRHYRRIQ